MSSKFVAPSQHPGSTRNTISNYKIVSSRMKIFFERRNSCYVSISRASHEAHIYTNNAASLGSDFSRDVSKSAALDFAETQSNTTEQSIGQQKVQKMEGLGLSL